MNTACGSAWGTPLVAGIVPPASPAYLLVVRPQAARRASTSCITKGNHRSRGSCAGAYDPDGAYRRAVAASGSSRGLADSGWAHPRCSCGSRPCSLAVAVTAGYTAFLFASVPRRRDLWQTPLMLPVAHGRPGSVAVGGAAATLFSTVIYGPTPRPPAELNLESHVQPGRLRGVRLHDALPCAIFLALISLSRTVQPPPDPQHRGRHASHDARSHFAREWWVGGQCWSVWSCADRAWAIIVPGHRHQDLLPRFAAAGSRRHGRHVRLRGRRTRPKAGQAVPLS